jgi:uncharacterized OB-fold protein
MSERIIPAPLSNPEIEHFWREASQGRFIIPFCEACARAHWYPRSLCPFCFSDRVVWRPASGQGTLYTYSITRLSDPVYVIAYVTLAEGPTMMTNIVDCDLDALAVGKPVQLVFKPSEGGPPVPMFRLA